MNLAYIPSPTFSKFEIGPVTIRMYAVCILIGICVAVWILTKRWRKLGGTFDQVLDTTLVTVPCALVGARLYHCITTPDQYFPPTGDLVNILKVWEGGMAIFGGISVGALTAFLWCRHRRYPFALLADSIAPALMVAQAIGRLGNWFNQELYGKPTTLPWGLKLNDADAIGKTEICYDGQACPTGTLFHPTFLYEMIWNLIGAALIVWLGHRLASSLKAGQQFAMYLMWYGLGRTWIESIRINYSTIILGLRINVWTAILCFILGAILFVVLWRYGGDTADLSKRLTAVTADELERASIAEEQAKAKKRNANK
ncbi:MAG: prolipoprotein diacylglyceryl transferase [Bifidobacterium scardovii]|uniref:prolipoprotein diacylglyceryl transferase n=1 Tax=Bifidobacterium scardovii TaxID=158787 RepID=UPI0006682128|nr:prolipoprotein diacylglyceryl transferase [Bifidobacterium scardovii]MBS6948330.1 prolipoprotein diacylglyceryl transferase [Bifidobacterium scardovii]MDU3736080.1 prolipoprotein diacylglyceryl transferase [Bifidobacterium scardovii]MDU5297797.1 prolipoprotein diacylglyceryl transferase [Bifidobacterium scardovii]MDU5610114.1 prolipoprotein diacylglyceryl transferase [Bifidobacterium scardovii]MDU5886679.1 prolipoprotein diacylglyceryl transferase [Bifidobacterium scardovii]